MKDVWIGLKDAPIWVLGAASVVALALCWITPLNALVPVSYRSYPPLLAFVLTVFTAARGVSSVTTASKARRERRRELASQRLVKLYRPMNALFNDRHLTASSAILAPYIRDRVTNAWGALRKRRGAIRKARAAWQALGDRRISTSAEMEFGSAFPLDDIKTIIRDATECADPELMNCVRQADRSRYEEQPDGTEVTEAEYALAEHIFSEHHRLTVVVER